MLTRCADRKLSSSVHVPWGVLLAAACALSVASGARALPLQIVTPSLPSGTAGVAYASAVVADLGSTPYTWTLAAGALPGGITLDGPTGALAGTATVAGPSDFIVLVTDALGDTATRAFSIAIAPAAPSSIAFTVQPSDVLRGAVMAPAVRVRILDAFANPVPGESVSLALVGTGSLSGGGALFTDGAGIATFSALSVNFAGSKQLTASSGALSPVTSNAFSVTCPAIALAPGVLPSAQAAAPYAQALSATGGIAPYTYAVTSGGLPPGLTLAAGGLLSGTSFASGVSSFTVTATDAAGCAGTRPWTLTVEGVPAAVGDLAAVRLTSGNDADGTSRIQVSFTPSAFAAVAEIYRAPFGGYPRYDDAGGVQPPTPSYPPGPPWVLTALTASGQTDEPATRDAWSYVVFLKNSFGQVSAVSNKTAPAPGYALGDVSNGLVAGQGDNLVSDADVSLLGAFYGISGSALTTNNVSYLDVGPTTDLALTSRPFTDGRIDFEDLIVFATNYGEVSAPALRVARADAARKAASEPERFWVDAPARVEAGQTFTSVVSIEAQGRLQGLSAEIHFDSAVAELLSVESAGWIESQQGVVLSTRPGTFDVALLGARAHGLSGAGDLVRATFRARCAGDPALSLGLAKARDAANRPLAESEWVFGRAAAAPAHTLLFAPAPNPSRGDAVVTFALAQAGEAELAIYSVDGRRVRVLAHGALAAGTHRFIWNGSDQQEHAVPPGLYFARLAVGGEQFVRTVVHLK